MLDKSFECEGLLYVDIVCNRKYIEILENNSLKFGGTVKPKICTIYYKTRRLIYLLRYNSVNI